MGVIIRCGNRSNVGIDTVTFDVEVTKIPKYRWTCPKLSCDKLYPMLSYKNVDPPTMFLCDKLWVFPKI